MFERFTESARRVMFWGRREAQAEHSDFIENRHLLLAVMRESSSLIVETLGADADVAIRKRFATTGPAQPNPPGDLPLSHQAKRTLAYSAEESERARHRRIGTQHVLLALLREDSDASAVLREHGLTLEDAREKFREEPAEDTPGGPSSRILLIRSMEGVPEDRIAAAVQVMEALRWGSVSVAVSGSGGSFTLQFGQSE